MPFPSSVSSTASLDSALKSVTAYAGAIKQRSQALSAASLAGSVDGAAVINFLRDLVEAKTRLSQQATTPGLAAYAQAQYNDQTLNIVNEYNIMLAAITSTIDWLRANFPKDANGYLLYEQIGADGRVTYRSFTTAHLVDFRTQLNALAATIA